MTRIAEIADRLYRLAKRRKDEGIYTDAALCEEAAAYLTAALAAEPGEAVAGCICQNQHRRGYCTEPRCPYAHPHPLPLKEERHLSLDEQKTLDEARLRSGTVRQILPLKEEVERVDATELVTAKRCAAIADDLSKDELFLDEKGRFGAELTAASIRAEFDIEDDDATAARALLSRIRAKTQEVWRDMASAPKDASSILYINKFGEIGYCYRSEAGSPFDQSMWWDDLANDECCPVGWLPADTLPASPSPEAKGGRS